MTFHAIMVSYICHNSYNDCFEITNKSPQEIIREEIFYCYTGHSETDTNQPFVEYPSGGYICFHKINR